MQQAVYEQQVVPAIQNFATAIQLCASVAYEPIDWAIAINEAIETGDPTCLAVATVPFVPATVVNTVKTAKKITKAIKGAMNMGDTLPSGIGSVVKVNRGSSSRSAQYQAQVTGFPFDYEYQLKYSKSKTHSKTVEFDGVKVENINGVDVEFFVEAKGFRYEWLFTCFGNEKMDEVIEQTKRQLNAIIENGIVIDLAKHKPLELHCAEEGAVTKFSEYLTSPNAPTIILDNGGNLRDYIQIIHTVFNP
jgi:hypothetical protein